MSIVPNPGHVELVRASDFVADQAYIDNALNNMDPQVSPLTNGGAHPCLLYHYNLNTDGYARIRYSIPGDYRKWDDNTDIYWNYTRGGHPARRRKLRDYRVYLHRYLFWRNYGHAPVPPNEISHLCHNRTCGEPSHLVEETHVQNLSRIGCTGHCGTTIHAHAPCLF